MAVVIPAPGETVEYLAEREEIRKAFDKAIKLTNDLDYALDLSGLEFAPASYGTKIQTWLENKYGWEGIPQTLNEGDFHAKNHRLVELKVSIIKKGAQANLLNLRLDTPVEHYMFIVRNIPTQTTKIFFVPKDGVQYMVDTFKEGAYNKHTEEHASIRVNTDSIVWEEDPDMNLWSYLQQFEIVEEDLANL